MHIGSLTQRMPTRIVSMAVAAVAVAGLATASSASTTAPPRVATRATASQSQGLTSAQESAYETCLPITKGIKVGTAAISFSSPESVEIGGYTDAAKLDGSALVGSALLDSSGGTQDGLSIERLKPNGSCAAVVLQPDYKGTAELPPMTDTFLSFGFMPVTATVQLTEVGLKDPPPITTVVYDESSAYPYTVVSTAQLVLQVLSAKVNGTTLDVGADCRTVTPLYTPDSVVDPDNDLIALAGGNAVGDTLPTFTSAQDGGGLAGDATIPPFTGCGASGDNLDPLFDSSIAGQGNYLENYATPVCGSNGFQTGCETGSTTVPAPAVWSVRDGGTFSATGPLSFAVQNTPIDDPSIDCANSAIKVSLPDSEGPPRGALGTFRWTSISRCDSQESDGTWTWIVSEQGTALLSPNEYVASAQAANLTASGIQMTFDGTGPDNETCDVTTDEPITNVSITYNDRVSGTPPAFQVDQGELADTVATGCPAGVFPQPGVMSNNTLYAAAPSGSYTLSDVNTVITGP